MDLKKAEKLIKQKLIKDFGVNAVKEAFGEDNKNNVYLNVTGLTNIKGDKLHLEIEYNKSFGRRYYTLLYNDTDEILLNSGYESF